MTNEQTNTLPADVVLACTLTPEEMTTRSAELGDFFAAAAPVEEPNGYAFRFPSDTAQAQKLLDFILFERDCCAHLTYELSFAPNHGPIVLRAKSEAQE